MQRLLSSLFLLISLISSSLSQDCLSTPWDPSCSSYNIPLDNLTRLNNGLCGMYMPGCTIKNICNDPKNSDMHPIYCDPFSIYKELCLDMPLMEECTTFGKMCISNTSIIECNKTILPLLFSRNYTTLIDGICSSMDMDGCDVCVRDKKCDKLIVYSNLCLQMDMKQCSNWHQLCALVPSWPICSGGNSLIPSMKMFFHAGINEYVFFKEWVPQNVGQYLLVLIFTLLASIGYEFLKLWRNRLINKYNKEKSEYLSIVSELKKPFSFDLKIRNVLVISTIYFIEICVGFLLMLLIMTYNIFICLAIVFGRYIGAIICGLIDDYTPDTKEVDCH